MIGGASGQTFVIDNVGDTIEFKTLGDPLAKVESYISYAAPDFVRSITLLGSSAISATGSAFADTLDGSKNAASNVLTGGAGDDLYLVDALDQVVEEQPRQHHYRKLGQQSAARQRWKRHPRSGSWYQRYLNRGSGQ